MFGWRRETRISLAMYVFVRMYFLYESVCVKLGVKEYNRQRNISRGNARRHRQYVRFFLFLMCFCFNCIIHTSLIFPSQNFTTHTHTSHACIHTHTNSHACTHTNTHSLTHALRSLITSSRFHLHTSPYHPFACLHTSPPSEVTHIHWC